MGPTMDELTPDAFVYICLLIVVIVSVYLFEQVNILKDKVATLERQMRELHRIVVANLDHED